MGKFVVVWKQEMEDGTLKILDATFNNQDDALIHIKRLKEDAITVGKPFNLISVTDLSVSKIYHPNKAHIGRNMKGKGSGSGWKGESRRHSLAKKGIKTKRGTR